MVGSITGRPACGTVFVRYNERCQLTTAAVCDRTLSRRMKFPRPAQGTSENREKHFSKMRVMSSFILSGFVLQEEHF
jgi:hypothetical protein